jgi:hypothetical protein
MCSFVGKWDYGSFVGANIQTLSYSPFNYHVQGLLHNLPDSVHKFTLDYDNNTSNFLQELIISNATT